MSIFRPENSPFWWIDIRTPNGKRVRRTTGTEDRRQAQEYHDRIKAELWNLDKLNKLPERTFTEAAVKVLRMAEGQKDYSTKACHIEYWRTVFSGRSLSSLTADEILENLPTHQLRREGDKRKPKKLAPATKNRYLATMSRILTVAEHAGWIVKKPKWDLYKESGIRIRWITKQEAQALLQAIKTPWMHDVCSFALSTGARMSEILKLEWSQVDLSRSIAWVTADKAKSGRSRAIPLNGDAMAVLERRKGRNKKWVFTRDTGVHASDINRRCFNLALTRANIDDFHFHDLRHTWASWHVQAGTPLFVLKELGGWENLEMVKKYAHMNAEHLAPHADLVRFWPYQPEMNAAETTKAACEAA